MTKLFKRFIAYAIDMMVVVLIAQSLSGVPFLNPNLDDYNKYYKEYSNLFETYGNFKVSLANDFKDKKLTEKEYQKLIEEYPNYEEVLSEKYQDQNLTEKEYEKINTTIDKEYQTKYKKVYYKIEKNSGAYFIIYLFVVFAYFIGFNKLTDGQTLGKKLTRLKIKNNKDEKKPVSVFCYFIRACILYQPIYYFVKLIGIFTLKMDTYYTVTSLVYDIQYYLEFLIVIMVMIRLDGRGPQDLLAGTRVALLDKEGKEIETPNVMMTTKKLKEKKVVEEPKK